MLNTPIEYVKGVGPAWAELLRAELGIGTLGDLLENFPFRYEDRTKLHRMADFRSEWDGQNVQLIGTLGELDIVGTGKGQRLVANLYQDSLAVELVWFQGVRFWKPRLAGMRQVLVYGRLQLYNAAFSIVHPEIEAYNPQAPTNQGLVPIYSTTEKLKKRKLDSKALGKLLVSALAQALPHIQDDLPPGSAATQGFISRPQALYAIHQPLDEPLLQKARQRLKFTELLRNQLPLCIAKAENDLDVEGIRFQKGAIVPQFMEEVLPFGLTDAQKRVLKEIWQDTHSGKHMNRLLQGDVGSGKTVVAFITILMAAESGFQACLMAPTEILADQHFTSLGKWAAKLGLRIEKLTGSVPNKARVPLHEGLRSGEVKLLVGTHALIEDTVEFQNLGLCIIDEQHRFGVSQRAQLRAKGAAGFIPHILIMTATPIPRTLALTKFADLDVSVIDQLPQGRKPIVTVHRYEKDRAKIYAFIEQELERGRQAYFVFPLIEENETLPLRALEAESEEIRSRFGQFSIGIVHGRMRWADREPVMKQFLAQEIQVLIATTVIEVGIHVANATIMVIENANRFGLAQLHQLRGRVGRGADQSYCMLLTNSTLSAEGRKRIQAMVTYTDGFILSELDLQMRGGGDMAGTQQSGDVALKLTDLIEDKELIATTYQAVEDIVASAGPQPRKILQTEWAKMLYGNHLPLQNLQKVG